MTTNIRKSIGWGVAVLVVALLAIGYWLMTMDVSEQQMDEKIAAKRFELADKGFRQAYQRAETLRIRMETQRAIEEQSLLQELKTKKSITSMRVEMAERDFVITKEISAMQLKVAELEAKLSTNQPWWFQ